MRTPSESVIIIGGGQSGLTAARAALDAGLHPVVLEAGPRPAGSWPEYYDSLRLFSPARFSSFPGLPFPGAPNSYPTKDDVAAYLQRYADGLDTEIRTGTRVTSVHSDGGRFAVRTADGTELTTRGVVAASGSFSNPHLPQLPGQDGFSGELLHVAAYRNPVPYEGKRVIVVGAGNSAVQVGYELSQVATTTVATRSPLGFWSQRSNGHDIHYRLVSSGFDLLPPQWLARLVTRTLVLDTGPYRQAVESGQLERRPMFTAFDGDRLVWPDGRREQADVVLFATGYRPSVGYLRPLGALDETGMPQHVGGVSTTHLGLGYLGLEFQRSFSSNTLRGVHRDAEYIMGPLAAHIHGTWSTVSSHDVSARLSLT